MYFNPPLDHWLVIFWSNNHIPNLIVWNVLTACFWQSETILNRVQRSKDSNDVPSLVGPPPT